MIPLVSRQRLHKYLNEKELYTKSAEDFEKDFSDEGARDQLYSGMLETGDYTKSREEFDKQFFSDLKKKDVTYDPQLGQVDLQNLPEELKNFSSPSLEGATSEKSDPLLNPPTVEQQYHDRIKARREERELREGLGVVDSKKNYLGTFAGSFNQPFVSAVSSLPKAVGIASRAIDEFIHGKAKPTKEYESYQLGEWIDKKAREIGITETDPEVDGFISRTVPGALGTVMAIMLTGGRGVNPNSITQLSAQEGAKGAVKALAKELTSAPALTGANLMGVQEFENAKESGASDEDAFKAYLGNLGVGTTEALPLSRALSRINEFTGGRISQVFKAGFKGGVEEATQEAIQTWMTNKIAQGTYDPNRDSFKDLIESMGAGMFVGFVLPGVMQAASTLPKTQRKELLTDINTSLKDESYNSGASESVNQGTDGADSIGSNSDNQPNGQNVNTEAQETPENSNLPATEEGTTSPALSEKSLQKTNQPDINASEVRSPVEEVQKEPISESSQNQGSEDIQRNQETGGETGNEVQQINDYGKEIEKRLPDSLSPEEKRGAIEGGEINAEATILTNAVHSAIGENEGASRSLQRLRKQEEKSIEEYAKEKGVWIEDKFGKPDSNGAEQDVYYNEEGTIATKVNPNLTHDTWKDFFDRLAVHNALFPDTPYKVKGFTDHNGSLSVVMEQPFVREGTKPVRFQDVATELGKFGFVPTSKSEKLTSKTTFVNPDTGVEISDLHGENVIKDDNGNLRFIDPIIEFTKERKNGSEPTGQQVSDENQRQASNNQGEERVAGADVQEESGNKGVLATADTGASVTFDWLGSDKKGTIIGEDNGKIKVKGENGNVYKVKPDAIKSKSESAGKTDIKKTSESVNNELDKITKDYKKQTNKPLKANVAPISLNVFYPIKQVWTGFNKAQHLITKKMIDSADKWIAAKVSQGIEHNNYVLRNASGVAQNLIGGLAYKPGDLKNKLDFTGNKNYGHLRSRMLSDQMYAMIDSDPTSLNNVHRALDPETWLTMTQYGEVLNKEMAKLKNQLSGQKGALSKATDIVKIDQINNKILDLQDEIDLKEVEIQDYVSKIGQSAKDNFNDQEKNLYDVIRATNDFIHEWYHDQGLLDDATYIEHKGNYIARLYEEIELADPEVTNLVKSTRPDFNIFKKRKDFADVQSTLIRDPVFATVKRMAQMLQTQAVFDYADALSKSGITIKDEAFPNSTQLGQPGKPYYGVLTGKYVPNYIAQDFKGFFFANEAFQYMYKAFRGYDANTARQFLKKLHTVYSPIVQLGNKLSNYSFGMWAGVDPYTFTVNKFRAAKEIKNKGAYYQDLVKAGLLGTDVLTSDLKPQATPGRLDKISDFASEYYGRADDESKLAAYMALLEDYGYGHDEAVTRVYNSFQNYATVGKLYDFASKTPIIGNPYIKFKADLGRIIKNGVINQPLTMAAYLGSLWYIKNLLSDLSDEDDVVQEIRERRSFIPKIKTPYGDIPMVWQVPGVGEVNFARFLSPYYVYDKGDKNDMLNDVTEWLPYQFEQVPGASPSKENALPLPEAGDVLLGPYFQSIVYDRDFRGKSVRDPKGNEFLTKEPDIDSQILNSLNYIARSQVPMYSSATDMYRAFNGEADYYGRERTIAQALINNVIKVQEFSDKQAREVLTKEIEYKVSKFHSIGRDIAALKSASKKEIAKVMASSMPDDRKELRIAEEVARFEKSALSKLKDQEKIMKELEDPNKLLDVLNSIPKVKDKEIPD